MTPTQGEPFQEFQLVMSPDPIRIDFPGLPSPAPWEGKPRGAASKGGSGFSRLPGRLLRWLGLLAFLAILPFFTLVRVSVFLVHRYELGSWLALGGGAVTTLVLLLLYLVGVSLRFGGKGRVPRLLLKGAGVLVGAYCLFTLLYISGGNVKTQEIRATYTSLNPILRVGVSTLLLVDRDGVLTASGRTLEDYEAWGLPPNEASLHLPQEDGFVYAVDIRTLGRPEWRNRGVDFYFRAMGFTTLRHSGTADHLHVAMIPPLL